MRLAKKAAEGVQERRVTELLVKFIGFRTVNPPGDEESLAIFLAEELRRVGLEVTIAPVSPKRPNVIAALETNRPGPTLILNTHMDVVPEGLGWTCAPFGGLVRDDRVYGRGAADAKGALASMVTAMEVLTTLKHELCGRVILAAVVDEEAGSSGSRALLPALKADMAIVGEPTGCRVCTAHKGTATVRIGIRGKSAHAANPDAGVNAIERAAALIERLQRYHKAMKARIHPLLGSPSAAVTLIKGGIKTNIIPDFCEVTVSRRMIPGESEASVASELSSIFAELADSSETPVASIDEFLRSSGGPSETPEGHPFVQTATRVTAQITGNEPIVHGFPLNCDMAQLRGVAGIPTIILGPGATDVAHQADEHVAISELGRAARVYAAVAVHTHARSSETHT